MACKRYRNGNLRKIDCWRNKDKRSRRRHTTQCAQIVPAGLPRLAYRLLFAAALAQPQERVCPARSAQPTTINSLRQSQRHSHVAVLAPGFRIDPANAVTVSRPQRLPVISFTRLSTLIWSITRRMRQRPLMFFAPNPIAQINITSAQRALHEMLGLGSWQQPIPFAHDGAAWPRLVDIHDRNHLDHLQKIWPRNRFRGQTRTVRCTSDRHSGFHSHAAYFAPKFVASLSGKGICSHPA
jgi:hypothetical protein